MQTMFETALEELNIIFPPALSSRELTSCVGCLAGSHPAAAFPYLPRSVYAPAQVRCAANSANLTALLRSGATICAPCSGQATEASTLVSRCARPSQLIPAPFSAYVHILHS
jgi:hypothetical protein